MLMGGGLTHGTLTLRGCHCPGLSGVGLNRFRGWGGRRWDPCDTHLTRHPLSRLSGVELSRFRGWGEGGVTHGTLTLRGCHCPGYLGWD